MNIDNTLVQKYAPLILSALVLIIPAVNVLAQHPSPVTLLQFVALLASTVAVYPLASKWKWVAEVVGVVVAAALPLALSGDLTWTNWALVAVAILKAVATHFGVILRRDPVTDAPIAPVQQPTFVINGGPVSGVVPVSKSDVFPGDGLGVDLSAGPASETPGPDHRAS